MSWIADWNRRVALGLFLFSFAVYAYTTSPSIAFWDCGEFVTTAYTLGIPHQPGTPLYVLVGRIFTLLPLGLSTALKINLMSAFFASLAVSFMYLTAVRLQRGWADEQTDPSPSWIVYVGAAVGSLFLAFSHTFWTNATEAEVYSLAAFTLAFTSYLAIRWYEVRDRESSATLMLIIVYLMGLAVGFHLGSILVYPGIFVLMLVADRKAFRAVDVWIVSAFMGTFVLSTMVKSNGLILVLGLGCLLAGVWRLLTWGTKDEHPRGAWFSLAGIGLFALGLSVHLFMLIRAGQDPMVNESDPETFGQLLSVLRREQYPPRNIFHREAALWWQLQHLWGTTVWGEGQSLAGKPVTGYVQQFTFFPRPGFLDRIVPLGFWLYGLYSQLRGNWRLFAGFFTTLLVNSIGLMLVLNFTDSEVRDRDYFYAGFYQFAALFLALGAGGLLRQVWLGLRDHPIHRPVLVAASAFLVFLPLMPVVFAKTGGEYGHPKFHAHDLSRNVFARNYGHNILAALPQDAVLFTNGDNDTFPLWYLQEVEGYRTDVRVVNLSLINLPWYIKQLRDYEPTVPIAWTDRQIDGKDRIVFRRWETDLVAQQFPDGEVYWIRDMAVWHVVRTNNWDRGIYFAVTIPNENIGMFVPYLSMEGLVYRLTPEKSEDGQPHVDTEAIWHNFTQVFDFEGVLKEDGFADRSIYRDHNTNHLLKNYPAALCRIGYYAALEDDFDQAIAGLEMAYRMDASFPVVGDLLPVIYLQARRFDEALDAARRFEGEHPDVTQVYVDVGEGLLTLGEYDRALEWSRERLDANPDDQRLVELAFRTHLFRNEHDEAERLLRDWVDRTGDPGALEELRRYREYLSDPPDATDSPSAPSDPEENPTSIPAGSEEAARDSGGTR